MSNPANPLTKYRSYSYHHILAICDSTTTATALAGSTDLDVWKHPNPVDQLGRFAPKDLPGLDKSYCILVNGMTDAAFVITHASWYSSTAADAVHGDRSTSLAVEGTLRISEPKGVVFLDQVITCCNSLGIDAAQAVFVLKTFFIGYAHDADNGDYVGYINDITPIQFIVYDVNGSFTEQGGEYVMDFVACQNGASRMPQYSKAAAALNVTAGANLQQTFKNLEKNINANYNTYFNCVSKTIKEAVRAAGGDADEIDRALARVNYVVDVGGAYASRPNEYKVTNQPSTYKDQYGCDQPVKFTIQPNTSIETAIQEIMAHCPSVLRDAAKGDPQENNVKYEYKIHTSLITKPITGTNPRQYEYTVRYYVDRFMRPASSALDFDNYDGSNAKGTKHIAENTIEFDYIYTGKNIDILEFDMKVNMGMAYLQTATTSSAFSSALNRSPAAVTVPSQQSAAAKFAGQGDKGKSTPQGVLPRVPILFGSEIKLPSARNSNEPNNSVQAAYTLAKHASLEIMDAKMKIIGNPALLGSVNKTTSPDTYDQNKLENTDTTVTSLDAVYRNWNFSPAFAKVRVMMPRNNDDIALMTGGGDTSASSDYAVDFWYNGYYYVCAIQHEFSEGEFTQTLEMIGVPQKDIFQSAQGNKKNPKELTFTGTVDECYNAASGCGAQTSQPGTKDTGKKRVAKATNCNDVQDAQQKNKKPDCNPEKTKK